MALFSNTPQIPNPEPYEQFKSVSTMLTSKKVPRNPEKTIRLLDQASRGFTLKVSDNTAFRGLPEGSK